MKRIELPSTLRDSSRVGALLLLVALAMVGLERVGALRWADDSLVEFRMGAAPRETTGDIVLVGIDNRSLTAMGAWPWRRDIYADMSRRLFALGAAEVFFDLDFSSPSVPGSDAALAEAIAAAKGTVILPVFEQEELIGDQGGTAAANLPLPELREHAWLATVNVTADADGSVRRYPWGRRISGEDIPSAAALLAGAFGPAASSFPINFSLTPESVAKYSAIDLIEGRLGAEAIAGRSVIVGAHALELRDQFAVPVHGNVGGAMLQVLAAETLHQGIMPITLNGLLAFFLVVPAALALVASPLRHRLGRLLLAFAAISVAIEATAFALFADAAIVMSTAAPHATLIGFGLMLAARELNVRDWLLHFAGIENRNSRSILQRIISDSSDAVIIVDEFEEIIQVSDRAWTLFGVQPRMRSAPSLDTTLPPCLAAAVRAALVPSLDETPSAQKTNEASFTCDGRTVHVEYTIAVSRIERPRTDARSSRELAVACMTARDVTLAREQQAKLDHLARFDSLTGALNRTEFTALLASALESDAQAVLAINMHRFKTVNSTLGRGAGDSLLRALVLRIASEPCISNVARLGGDTFAVACPGLGKDEAGALAQRLLEMIAEPFDVDGAMARVAARIGVAVSRVGSDAEFLVSKSETALDIARQTTGEGVSYYEPEIFARQARARQLERALASAIASDELYVAYQPQLDLETLHPAGAEALLRWDHPVFGQISPAEFVPIAEGCGLVEKLGRWVLEHACRDAATWPTEMLVAVNVSPLQLERGDLVADVRRALAASGLDPRRLQIEITESLFLGASEQLSAKLETLRSMGVSIALDDFGSGFSCLGNLAVLPIDKLKLDRVFARDIGSGSASAAIVKAVATFARELGVTLLCEGIETTEQHVRFLALGCQEGQGFLFAKPQTQAEILDLLSAVEDRLGALCA